MSCDVAYERISAYADGELAASDAADLERHLATCQACRASLEALRRLRNALADAALRAPASGEARDALRERLRASLPTPPATSTMRSATRWAPRVASLWAAAATLALVALGSFQIGAWWSARGRAAPITDALVSSHMRSLLGEHLVDVVSSDRHTVKPWFAGRIDYAPPVPDLSTDGFPLRGGRIDVLAGRRVAALVYQSDRHVISLFTWPSGDVPSPDASALRGYALEHWQSAGLDCWAVSDVEPARLRGFAEIWRLRANAP